MIDIIVKEVQDFNNRIAELKKYSYYYPSILIKNYDYIPFPGSGRKLLTVYASTLVRIKREEKWYIVHCVESVIPNNVTNEKDLLLKIMDSVHRIQNLYQIGSSGFQDIDILQISEEERLRNSLKSD
jgi:hypothetical protein